jgi:hypothetical protein
MTRPPIRIRGSATVISTILILLILPQTGHAAWPCDPAVNAPVCIGPTDPEQLNSISDGSGGTIVAWMDTRGGPGTFAVYGQRLDASGTPEWTLNGVLMAAVHNSTGTSPVLTSDGAGGAIVAWSDQRISATYQIFAQRVDAQGAVEWQQNGVALANAVGVALSPQIIPETGGGAIVTWYISNFSGVYAQRIDAAGTKLWGPDGVTIRAPLNNQSEYPVIAADGGNGAIIAWDDQAEGVGGTRRIIAQRVSSDGVAQWQANGVEVSNVSVTDDDIGAGIVADQSGGAIVTWQLRTCPPCDTDDDIIAQDVDAAGAKRWDPAGVPLCTAPGVQSNARSITDGRGGAIVTWLDARSGVNSDVYVQRISASGVAQWTADGAAVFTGGAASADPPVVVSERAGGAIIAWADNRLRLTGPSRDVFAQRLSSAGAVQWEPNGSPVCLANGDQHSTAICSDGEAGAIVAWVDGRSNAKGIYAQQVRCLDPPTYAIGVYCKSINGVCQEQVNPVNAGNEPFISVPQGAVIVFTVDSGCTRTPCSGACMISPTGEPNGATWPASSGSVAAGGALSVGPFTDVGTYTYDILCSPGIAGTIQVTSLVGVASAPQNDGIVLYPIIPNPTTDGARVAFALPREEDVVVRVIDSAGRMVSVLAKGHYSVGTHQVWWNGKRAGRRAGAGVYFAQCNCGGRALVQRFVLLR